MVLGLIGVPASEEPRGCSKACFMLSSQGPTCAASDVEQHARRVLGSRCFEVSEVSSKMLVVKTFFQSFAIMTLRRAGRLLGQHTLQRGMSEGL